MSGEHEYDPFEYAKALEEGEDLGRSDLDENYRLSRRDLLVKGAAGAAAVGAAGALAGSAAAGDDSVDKNGKFTGTLRVLSLGVEFPIPDIAKQASKDLGFTVKPILAPVADPAADRDHVAGHVRRLRRLQLPVAPGLAVRRTAAGRHPPDRELGRLLQAVHARQAQPGVVDVHVRTGECPVPDDVRRPERLHRPACIQQRAGQQQADHPLDRGGRKADRRQAAAPVDRRTGGAFQRRLDGLQRRRHQEGRRTRSRGPSS